MRGPSASWPIAFALPLDSWEIARERAPGGSARRGSAALALPARTQGRRRPRRANASAIAALATPAPRNSTRDAGWPNPGDRAHTASVAISVARSHASAHQSSSAPRRAAVACAAANVSQIGPHRRSSAAASADGGAWPSARRVARGARSAAVPSIASKPIIARLARSTTRRRLIRSCP